MAKSLTHANFYMTEKKKSLLTSSSQHVQTYEVKMFCFLMTYKNLHILLEGLTVTLCATTMETVLIQVYILLHAQ